MSHLPPPRWPGTKPLHRRHAGKFQLLGTQAAGGQVSSSIVGSRGKSSELSLTLVVKTGHAGLPPTQGGGSVSIPGQKERSSVLACWLLAFAACFYDVLLCS